MVIVLHYLPKVQEFLFGLRIERANDKLFKPNLKFFLIIWAIIFACWIPVFLASYPGVYCYDAPYQMAQITQFGQLNAHHPILHTLYLYGTMTLGNIIFGSYTAGMAIYSITQMLMLSAAFAFAIYYMTKLKVPVFINVLTIIYFALVPTNGILSVSATKDVLFAAIVLLLVLFIIDLVKDKEKFFGSFFLMTRFVVIVMLMMFMRNNGFYALLFFIPFFIWFGKKHWIKSVAICAICVAANFLYTGPLYSVANVQKGDIREAFSIPTQQIARAVKYNSDKLTDEELAIVGELFDTPNIGDRYYPRTADFTKGVFNTELFKSDMGKYLKVYFSIGFKSPGEYTNAFLTNSIGSWYPDMNYPDQTSYHPYLAWKNSEAPEFGDQVDKYILIERQSLIPFLDNIYGKIVGMKLQNNTPVISMVFSPGFGFWLLVLFTAICIYFKKYRYLLPIVILFGLWVTVILSPVALLRYSYPIMVCTPILIGLVFRLVRDKTKELEQPEKEQNNLSTEA